MQAGNVTGVNGGPVLGDPRFPPSYRLVGEAADAAADIADADLAYATQHLTTYREPRGVAPPPAVVDPWAQYRHRPQPWSYTQVYGRPGAAASSSSNYYAAPAPPPAVHPTYVRTGDTAWGRGAGSSSPQRVRPYMSVQAYAAPMYVPVAPAPTYPYDPAYSEYTPMDPTVRRRAA